jgi:uncharacterized membrane protein YkvA (DUF1232 family)
MFGQSLEHLRERARSIKREQHAVYLALKDPRVPWYAKALVAVVLAFLFSPIDLIPDFIPVIGYLDDLIVVPAGLLLVIRLIPPEVMAEHRQAARAAAFERKPNWIAVAVIVGLWLLLLALVVWFIVHRLRPSP